ncbi:MAG TPA: hypothetical protein VG271_15995, partial [Beijerinckiaceae bacterium]|nr:hypothetical protein [Beijerinckiaceae bacterium]
AALLILLKRAAGEAGSRSFALAGLMAGLGVGLKYTVATFLPGLGLVCLVVAWRGRSLFAPLLFGVAVILGFLAAAGHHLLTLWQTFGNPTFPFLNNVFKSPWYEVDSLLDTQFIPRDFWQYAAYPFYWTRLNSYVVTELPFRDWRGAIAYVAILGGLAAFALHAKGKWRSNRKSAGETCGLLYLFLFIIVSFFVWEKMFGNLRYGVVLELVAGIATIGALIRIVDDGRARTAAALALVGVLAATTVYIDWGHRAYGAKYVEVEVPQLPPQSDVLVATWDAVSYFIPYAEPSAHYLGIENNYLYLTQHNKLADAVRNGMRTPGTAKFVLSVGDFDADKLDQLLANFDLKLSAAPCLPIHTNLVGKALSLCPAEPR